MILVLIIVIQKHVKMMTNVIGKIMEMEMLTVHLMVHQLAFGIVRVYVNL